MIDMSAISSSERFPWRTYFRMADIIESKPQDGAPCARFLMTNGRVRGTKILHPLAIVLLQVAHLLHPLLHHGDPFENLNILIYRPVTISTKHMLHAL